MRQLFTWRFVAALGALAALALVLNAVLVDDTDLTAVIAVEPLDRRIDLIASVQFIATSDDFELQPDGTTAGFIDVVLDSDRAMRIAPGTPGVIECDSLDSLNRCAVFADLLGEAVVWFALLPKADRETVELPPVIDLQDGYALFDTGWQIRYPPVIDRQCDPEDDITSFSDFLRRFGPSSTSIVDLATQQVAAVRCAGSEAPEVVPSTTEVLDIVPTDVLDEVPAEVLDVVPTDVPVLVED